jgi:hypothetical protein
MLRDAVFAAKDSFMSALRLSFLRTIVSSSLNPRISPLAYHLTGDSERPPRMTEGGPRKIRETANTLLDAFVQAVEKAYQGRPVTPAELRRIADALKTSSDFDVTYEKAFSDLHHQALAYALSQTHDAQRVELFHRVMTRPLDPLLDSEGLKREALSNFFNFLRLVLGEEVDLFQQRCVEAHDELKTKFGDNFSWEMLYTDDRTKIVLYTVLMRIAAAFKRFDARKDWFIGLMQYSPMNIGIATNVFVPNPHHDKNWTFGEPEFKQMFKHLFAPVRSMTTAERELFANNLGATPDSAFAAFFRELG